MFTIEIKVTAAFRLTLRRLGFNLDDTPWK